MNHDGNRMVKISQLGSLNPTAQQNSLKSTNGKLTGNGTVAGKDSSSSSEAYAQNI